jgi:UDP-N-acetyl-D-mannosaminuronic acid dehydrogenase
MSFSTISVIGLGYIGLPTAAAFASRQKRVVGVDINQHAVETINRGEIHIVEPDLASVVKTAVEQGYLRHHRAGRSRCLPDCRADAV